ncbi:MAG: hypothetical protein WAZ40_03105 [Minisyncoccia bacterium]
MKQEIEKFRSQLALLWDIFLGFIIWGIVAFGLIDFMVSNFFVELAFAIILFATSVFVLYSYKLEGRVNVFVWVSYYASGFWALGLAVVIVVATAWMVGFLYKPWITVPLVLFLVVGPWLMFRIQKKIRHLI